MCDLVGKLQSADNLRSSAGLSQCYRPYTGFLEQRMKTRISGPIGDLSFAILRQVQLTQKCFEAGSLTNGCEKRIVAHLIDSVIVLRVRLFEPFERFGSFGQPRHPVRHSSKKPRAKLLSLTAHRLARCVSTACYA